jgi:hypothetical protein
MVNGTQIVPVAACGTAGSHVCDRQFEREMETMKNPDQKPSDTTRSTSRGGSVRTPDDSVTSIPDGGSIGGAGAIGICDLLRTNCSRSEVLGVTRNLPKTLKPTNSELRCRTDLKEAASNRNGWKCAGGRSVTRRPPALLSSLYFS